MAGQNHHQLGSDAVEQVGHESLSASDQAVWATFQIGASPKRLSAPWTWAVAGNQTGPGAECANTQRELVTAVNRGAVRSAAAVRSRTGLTLPGAEIGLTIRRNAAERTVRVRMAPRGIEARP